MDKILLIVELIGAVCALIPTLVSVYYLIKNIIKNKDWDLVKKIAMSAMSAAERYAEEHPGMSGEEKLDFALEIIKSGLAEAGIKTDPELIKRIVAYIEEMCKWSKTVNITCNCCND